MRISRNSKYEILVDKISPAVLELSKSAFPRLKEYRSSSMSAKLFGLSVAVSIPLFLYSVTYLGNNILGVQFPDPVTTGVVSGISVSPAPFLIADNLNALNSTGNSLSYNSKLDLVARLNDKINDGWYGFHPLLLGDKPFMLQKGEAQIMPVKTYYSSTNNVEATVDGIETILEIPGGVQVKENSDGIGAIKRTGTRGFVLLAFASYDSFL